MAYPLVDAPYGFKAINELNGLPYAGATRQIPVPYNNAVALFNGDLVEINGSGLIRLTQMSAASSPGTAIAGQVGVFVGCSYTNPSTGQKLFAQYLPAGTLANDITAYVVDDPSALFKVVMVGQAYNTISNTVSAVGYANQTLVGTNLYAVTGVAGSTTTGNSKMAVSGSYPAANGTGVTRVSATALPFRMVAVVPETAVTVTGSGTCSSTTITLDAAVTGLQAGMQVVVPGTSGGYAGQFNTVTNVNGTTVTISGAMTISSSTQLSFVGFPEVLVKWNQGYHSYQFATGVA